MSQLTAYLNFNGNCAEAMRFYERALGGKMEGLMKQGEAPGGDQLPPGSAERVMHAALQVNGGTLMAADTMVGQPQEKMSGFALALHYDTVDEGKRAFNALADGGKVIMPFEPTFWAKGYGMLVDRFGTPWMVNVSNPQP